MHTPTQNMPTETLIGPDHVMDVREIPCSVKHGLILSTCVKLPVGGHFILLNGHDPVPLRDRIATIWPDAFAWEYLAQRENEVRVKITKLKAVTEAVDMTPSHACSH
jgi:uncharacterized protein (DUF2249 family)